MWAGRPMGKGPVFLPGGIVAPPLGLPGGTSGTVAAKPAGHHWSIATTIDALKLCVELCVQLHLELCAVIYLCLGCHLG